MRGQASGTSPILCAHLLRRVDGELIDLLRSLSTDEWDIQTIAPAWKVRDVAAHLLDTVLRKLSLVRDSCYVEAVDIQSPQDVVTLVNHLNREGVTVYRRVSPAVLIELMQMACEQSARFHESLDPFAPAAFAVSCAGEEKSLNWFDTARELTERWHHQQQIRLAANRPGIMVPDLYHPVLDCFVRGPVPGTCVPSTRLGGLHPFRHPRRGQRPESGVPCWRTSRVLTGLVRRQGRSMAVIPASWGRWEHRQAADRNPRAR